MIPVEPAEPTAGSETPQEDQKTDDGGNLAVVVEKSYQNSAVENVKILAVLALTAWATLRLFLQFGDYDYYYGVSYVFDVIAIYILFRVATIEVKHPQSWIDIVRAYQRDHSGYQR